MKGWEHLKSWEIVDDLVRRDLPNVYPRPDLRLRAYELTPYDKVKVVILGQDPYPTKGHAHGLAFSCQPHVRPLPASLRNIYKEYHSDLGFPEPRSGDLSVWAERGVLLLNTILTVEEGKALSHAGLGWEKLTYETIRSLADKKIVFLLMGRKAQEYCGALDPTKVVSVPHPSPLAKGFSGTRPFTAVNAKLRDLGVAEVDWRLP